MFQLRENTPRWVVIVVDLFIAFVSLALSYLIRFDLKAKAELIQREWIILSKSILFFFIVKFLVFFLFKIHRGLVRHTSGEDMGRIFIALTVCSVIYLGAGLIRFNYLDGYFLFPTSVLLMEYLISLLFMIGSRFILKFLYLESIKVKGSVENVLIYGAGISGMITKRSIEKDTHLAYKIIAYIDDNKNLDNNRLEGKPIFHTSRLKELIERENITLVIVAIQSLNENNRKFVLETCLENQIKVQKVPSVKKWVNNEFSTKQISKIKIEDLLGRVPIVLDEQKTEVELKDKCILVTGAAGSIGSGIVRQLANYSPKKIILLDQAESPLYDFQHELLSTFPDLNFEIVVGDIRSFHRMEKLFMHFNPNYVFHAAAYKHVPLMENNPSEAVLTNIKGTKNLVDLSIQFCVHKFVLISTDKAVNPTNVMGASKRIAEIYAQTSNAKNLTKFITTRFGNVLGSNGSVIPLFQRQIEQGGPVTVTDERITRFFMTIPEACQLVLEAGIMGEGGEIFVFDMGDSVKIIDLAKKMIQLSGLEVGKDIEIKVTGLRPGEKLYEELLAASENTIWTHHPQILKAKIRPEEPSKLIEIEKLIALFDSQNNLEIVSKMKEIVPEYISQNSDFAKLDKNV